MDFVQGPCAGLLGEVGQARSRGVEEAKYKQNLGPCEDKFNMEDCARHERDGGSHLQSSAGFGRDDNILASPFPIGHCNQALYALAGCPSSRGLPRYPQSRRSRQYRKHDTDGQSVS